ncbi:MAG: hypothetical protein ACI8UO_003694 [Verrucomicrobiales bacterium]|jgi:hypothetical protein
MAEQDSDFDGPWKAAGDEHFERLLKWGFPRHAALVDWSKATESGATELSQIIGEPQERNDFVDTLRKVRFIDGGEAWIWFHIEFQTDYRSAFVERAFFYNCGLVWIRGAPVITLIVRCDLSRTWKPACYEYVCEDFKHAIEFPTCKLTAKLNHDWKDDFSLIPMMARAQIAALRTAGDPEGRFDAKWQLLRNLYRLGLPRHEFQEIFRLIDWMMHLRDDLRRRFLENVAKTEVELKMNYVTSIEQLGIEKGRAGLLVHMLEAACDQKLDEALQNRIGELSAEDANNLGVAMLRFEGVADLESWLAEHP